MIEKTCDPAPIPVTARATPTQSTPQINRNRGLERVFNYKYLLKLILKKYQKGFQTIIRILYN